MFSLRLDAAMRWSHHECCYSTSNSGHGLDEQASFNFDLDDSEDGKVYCGKCKKIIEDGAI